MAISEFSDLLLQTITIEPFVGHDGYGNTTYGTAVSYFARVVGKRQLIRDMKGQEVTSEVTVYLLSNVAVDPKSRITLPSDFVPTQPPILATGRYPDESGEIHHTQIFL